MDGTSSAADLWQRIAELEAQVEKLNADNENLRQARKIAKVQLREQKEDYVRTLGYLSDVLQKSLERRLA
jgi:cell division protein FtsB